MNGLLGFNPTLRTFTESVNTIPALIPILERRLKQWKQKDFFTI
jgi:hypothetical protein